MKILDITLKNLNSLAGGWHIDLKHKDFSEYGIFVITGVTGAGKSTIFDAICLALYGRTPRLGRIQGQSNDVMTKNTKECSSCVIFENDKGKFSCYWHQDKKGSKFNSVYHEIAKLDENNNKLEIITRDTVDKVKEITGMDFERFTQAMLLAQGGFDEFLKANKNSRAEILELITGSDIYSEISRRVYQRSKDENLKLEALKKSLEEIKAANNFKPESEILKALELAKNSLNELEQQRSQINNAVRIMEDIEAVKIELTKNNNDLAKLELDKKNFAESKIKLDAAVRAESLNADYQYLISLRARLNDKEDVINNLEIENENAEQKLNELKSKLPGLNSKLTSDYESVSLKLENMLNKFEEDLSKYNDLVQKRNEIIKKGINLKNKMQAAEAERNKMNFELQKINSQHDKIPDAFKNLLAGMHDSVIINERNNLKDGLPCPVCGAREHFLRPVKNFNGNTENILNRAEDLKAQADKLRQHKFLAEKDFTKAEQNFNEVSVLYQSCRQEYSKSENPALVFKNLDAFKNEIIKLFSQNNIQIGDDMRKNLNNWREQMSKLESMTENLKSQIRTLEATLMTREEFLDNERESLTKISDELKNSEERFAMKMTELKFSGESEFRNALMPGNELENLKARSKDFETQSISLETTRRNNENKLKELQAII